MEQSMIKSGETGIRYQDAVEVTCRIRLNGNAAANALYQVCKDLKLVRDEKYFVDLGYKSFEEYTQSEFGIMPRQAYNYISSLERLGDGVLQSNADIGITKLALLAEVPALDRDDVMENNDIAGMSTREVEELVKKVKDTGEQLSLITSERDKAKTEADNSSEEAAMAQQAKDETEKARADAVQRLEEAQNRIAELEKAEPDADTLESLKKAAEKEANKGLKDKIKAETDKALANAKTEADKKIEAARAEGEKTGAEKIKFSLDALEKEKADALTRAAELEKKLSVAGNQETVIVLHLSEELQTVFGQLCGSIAKIRTDNPDTADKFKAATHKMIDMLSARLDEA
jgi:hypothetical protein